MAQGPSFNSLQRTTDAVGMTSGQTARLTIVYPTVPAPLLQTLCSVTLVIKDTQGAVLKSMTVDKLVGGTGVTLDVNADNELSSRTFPAGAARVQIYGLSIATCHLVTSLEILDNLTLKTIAVAGSHQTYPVTISTRVTASKSELSGSTQLDSTTNH